MRLPPLAPRRSRSVPSCCTSQSLCRALQPRSWIACLPFSAVFRRLLCPVPSFVPRTTWSAMGTTGLSAAGGQSTCCWDGRRVTISTSISPCSRKIKQNCGTTSTVGGCWATTTRLLRTALTSGTADGSTYPATSTRNGDDGRHQLDIQICRRVEDEWVLSDDPRVALPMSAALGTAPWGNVPVVSALIILYYKAVPPRWR